MSKDGISLDEGERPVFRLRKFFPEPQFPYLPSPTHLRSRRTKRQTTVTSVSIQHLTGKRLRQRNTHPWIKQSSKPEVLKIHLSINPLERYIISLIGHHSSILNTDIRISRCILHPLLLFPILFSKIKRNGNPHIFF